MFLLNRCFGGLCDIHRRHTRIRHAGHRPKGACGFHQRAGSWTAVWIILALAFAVFIYFHGDMVHGIENFDDLKLIASRYASHLKLDPNDYEGVCSNIATT